MLTNLLEVPNLAEQFKFKFFNNYLPPTARQLIFIKKSCHCNALVDLNSSAKSENYLNNFLPWQISDHITLVEINLV